ncbi:hypothetical protein T492DRAFT_492916 [Pavlovales sp. CCMP2436]|nr:hypothetical protein T492DRAFT_492916 [Pavlovales sp. CCMP2436]
MQAPKRWIPLSRSSASPCNRLTRRARLRGRAHRGRLAQDRGPRRPVRALLARRARGGTPTCSCAWLAGRPRRASPFVLFALNSSQTMPSPMNVNGKAPMAKCSHCTMQLLARLDVFWCSRRRRRATRPRFTSQVADHRRSWRAMRAMRLATLITSRRTMLRASSLVSARGMSPAAAATARSRSPATLWRRRCRARTRCCHR